MPTALATERKEAMPPKDQQQRRELPSFEDVLTRRAAPGAMFPIDHVDQATLDSCSAEYGPTKYIWHVSVLPTGIDPVEEMDIVVVAPSACGVLDILDGFAYEVIGMCRAEKVDHL